LVIEGNNLLLQKIIDGSGVFIVSCVPVFAFGSKEGPAVLAVVAFYPPAVQDAELRNAA